MTSNFLSLLLNVLSQSFWRKHLRISAKVQQHTPTSEPEAVNVHDFPQDAAGKAVPYGISDVLRNCGTVYVGSSSDTPEFAVAALARWWKEEGCIAYPNAKQILILADSGGSNGCRPRPQISPESDLEPEVIF